MNALVTWLVSAAVFAVPVLCLSMQVMAAHRMQGALRTFAIAVGVRMVGLFVCVVWAVIFADGTMAPMLLVAAAPFGLIVLFMLWALHWIALRHTPPWD
jgi:hypothetical protein